MYLNILNYYCRAVFHIEHFFKSIKSRFNLILFGIYVLCEFCSYSKEFSSIQQLWQIFAKGKAINVFKHPHYYCRTFYTNPPPIKKYCKLINLSLKADWVWDVSVVGVLKLQVSSPQQAYISALGVKATGLPQYCNLYWQYGIKLMVIMLSFLK